MSLFVLILNDGKNLKFVIRAHCEEKNLLKSFFSESLKSFFRQLVKVALKELLCCLKSS